MTPAELDDLEKLIAEELHYFDSDEQRQAFRSRRIPLRLVVQDWGYSDAVHDCYVIAEDERQQIVYCRSGFGPSFPWSSQRRGAADLGMDADWCAYLYESFVTSSLWPGERPEDLELMGPGERERK
ncbi:MAG TPA: hypothetical protein VEG34_12310 [Thermoanaerobaculia bacterium]|nr:hypothetical protein [Thermoanaerobaculia bacterium]